MKEELESNLNIMYIGWVDCRFWQGLFGLEGVEIKVTNSEGRDTGGFSALQEKVDLPELRYGAGCRMAPGTSATEVPSPPSLCSAINVTWLLSLCQYLFALLPTHSVSLSLNYNIPKGN